MIAIERKKLEQVLEALINAIAVRNGEGGTKLVSPLEENAITAIKEALAPTSTQCEVQPVQEPVGPEYMGIPVAYQYLYSDGSWRCSFGDPINGSKPIASRALYARKDGK